MSHLVQEVELRDVGGLCLQQLVGDVEDSLLDRQLDRQKATVTFLTEAEHQIKKNTADVALAHQPITAVNTEHLSRSLSDLQTLQT